MKATHRVKASNGSTVGFIIDNHFITSSLTKKLVDKVDNLSLLKNGRFRANKSLNEISYKEAFIEKEYQNIVKNNPFKREIQDKLISWKKNSNKVLQLQGSRQIGKTTEIKKFAYSNYEYVIYVNLADDRFNFQEALNYQAQDLWVGINDYCKRAMLPEFDNSRNTIIIIDEIQSSAKVYNSIRLMREGLDCDIIVTGSYLGIVLQNDKYFIPAGTIDLVEMFTLSFREFCNIFKQEENLRKIDLYGNSDNTDYDKLAELYLLYIQIGGYPEVIQEYLRTRNINSCYNVIEKLLETFRNESYNYIKSPKEVQIFNSVYRESIYFMCKEKKGTGNNILKDVTDLTHRNSKLLVSRDEVSNAISWIIKSGIIGLCSLANDGDIRDIIESRRMYFLDCGITSFLCKKYRIENTNAIGLLSETFVFNELNRLFKEKFDKRKVLNDNVCFSVLGDYELDFMVQDKDGVVYGIEVKTKSGEPTSLKVFLKKRLVDKGVVAKHTKGGHGSDFDTIPIYTVGCRFPYK